MSSYPVAIGYNQAQQQKQKTSEELKAEVFKAMIKQRINAQMMSDQAKAYKDLVGSGDFEVSIGPSGLSFSPISPADKLKNLEATETLREAGYGGQSGSQAGARTQPNTFQQPQAGPPPNLSQYLSNAGAGVPAMTMPQTNRPGGGGLLEVLRRKKLQEKQAEADLKMRTQAAGGRKMGRVNVNIVGGAFKRLAQTYADATQEGATGDIYRSGFARHVALGGVVPKNLGGGKLQEKFKRTAAYEGQKTEVITKMMPMLTQQGDKPGSVRLIRSIFDRLSKTIPQLHHDTGPAFEMIRESMKNMYGFAAAVENAGGMNAFVTQLGYSPDVLNGLSKQQLDMLASNAMTGLSDGSLGVSIDLRPAQERELNNILSNVLSPITNTRRQSSGYQVIRRVR